VALVLAIKKLDSHDRFDLTAEQGALADKLRWNNEESFAGWKQPIQDLSP
jgi:hypothetical protein